jgi:hypothetical protein
MKIIDRIALVVVMVTVLYIVAQVLRYIFWR